MDEKDIIALTYIEDLKVIKLNLPEEVFNKITRIQITVKDEPKLDVFKENEEYNDKLM